MPRVYNKHHRNAPVGAVYVGRPGPWGNPFVIGADGTRAEVIRKFREWVMRPQQAALREQATNALRGKDLVCWCHPKDCHASVWLEIVNGEEPSCY